MGDSRLSDCAQDQLVELWEQVEEKQMLRGLKKSKTPKDWLLFMEHPLKQQGLELGREMDNYSAIAVFLQR